MNTAVLAQQLATDEATRLKPYDDATGKELQPGDTLIGNITIGIGCNLQAGLDRDMVMLLLEWNLRRTFADLDRNLPWWRALTEARQQGLANICFNIGITRLLGFKKALGFLQAGRWDAAAAEFLDSRWAGQVKDRAQRIARQIREG